MGKRGAGLACCPASNMILGDGITRITELADAGVFMSPRAITDVWAHGRHVVKGRRLATLDQDALMERVTALTRGWTPA